jgi:Kdo2-lipid IVA lauroyltransferase/acyltransferase
MLWIFRFFSLWPLAALHALGGALGWLVWACSRGYRAQFRANVAQAGLPFEAARPAIAETGRFVGELPKLWMRPQTESCMGNVQVEGHALAVQAFTRGKGVVFFGAHAGSFELGSQALAELYGPVTAMYRPARKAWLARLEGIARSRPNLAMVPADVRGIRAMHRTLKANQAVALLMDQVPPEGLGVWAPFFGKPAYTMTLVARLALQNGAALLPVSCERLPHAQGYRLRIWAPVEVIGRADVAAQKAGEGRPAGGVETDKDRLLAAVTRLNQAVEAIVLSQPDQYLWAYARYKTPRRDPAPARPPAAPIEE